MLLRSVQRARTGRLVREVLRVANVSTSILDLLLDDVARHPEKVAPLIEALRPHLPTETGPPPSAYRG